MVEQSGEPFLFPFFCCFPHTGQSLGHAFPTLCRAHARLNDVLLSLCPSLPGLRRRLPFFVRLVHWYYGTVRLLLNVRVRRSVYGLRGPVLFTRARRAGDLPVLVHVVSQRARVLRLRRTEQTTRELTCLLCCLPPLGTESASCSKRAFRSSIAGPPIPLSTLQATPRGAACKTRGQDGFAALLSCLLGPTAR